MTKILIVEDEKPISDLIKLNLQSIGYEIYQSYDGEDALSHIKNSNFDLVLLDIMLPKIDGYNLIPNIKEKNFPVIILTAKNALNDKVLGFNLGADDYITKPFEVVELIARVKAVLRRTTSEKSEKNVFTFDNIKIDFNSRHVYKDNSLVELTLKEYELLKVLIENKNSALSRDRLLDIVWGYDYLGNTRTVDMHIKNLRKKLDIDNIKTVYKIGYMFES